MRRWVCPYHQWSHDLGRRLLGCGREETVDIDAHGVGRAAVAEIAGLVFVWLGPDPAAVDDAARDLGAAPAVVQSHAVERAS